MRDFRLAFLPVAVLAWVGVAQGASLKEIGPQASAAQLIAARGAPTASVLRLTYAGEGQTQTVVEIAADYVFVRQTGIEKGALAVLSDYALRRIINLDQTAKSFVNNSMYAMADFRFAESYNRRMLRGVLAKAGVQSGAMHPYFDQQDLGIASPDDGTVSFEREHTKTGGLKFVVQGKTAASFEPSSENLSPAEAKGLLRFLRASCNLHPEMITAISSAHVVPQQIMFLTGRPDQRKEQRWTLQSVERLTDTYPLTPDYRVSVLSPALAGASPMNELLPIMLESVAGRYRDGPRSPADYRAAQAEALAKGNVLQHFLLDNEMSLQYRLGTMACFSGHKDSDDCSNRQQIMETWKADPATMTVLQAFALERQNPKEAVARRNAISRARLTNAYMLDLWNADTLMQSNQVGDALPLFAMAIKGNPYVGGFYKDLGDAYRYSFSPEQAWLCYDLARALPGGETAPIVDGLSRMERQIEIRSPDFF